MDAQLWVWCFGVFGGIGFLLAAHHLAHEAGHALHSPVVQIALWLGGLTVAYVLMRPVIQDRTLLTGEEILLCLTLGTVGFIFLLYEMGHKFHHHPRIGWGAAALIVVVALLWWYGRPETPPAAVDVPPVGAESVSFWWVSMLGFFGAIGIVFATYHFAHVWYHWTHNPVPAVVIWVLGVCIILFGLLAPVYRGGAELSGPEAWCLLMFGTFGLLFLLYEAGHWLHHHPRVATAVCWLGLGVVLACWYNRPLGTQFTVAPEIVPRIPTYGPGPGFGGSTASSAASPVPDPTTTPPAAKPKLPSTRRTSSSERCEALREAGFSKRARTAQGCP